MQFQGPNHPFVVWAACYLWIVSIFSIVVSFLLFVCVGDMLILTGMDIINAFVLLSGIIMLPTNVYMVYCVAKGKKIDNKAKVFCCPVWCCVLWIIIIDTVGAILCIQRIFLCYDMITQFITIGMKKYKNAPRYKHFIDNLQWSLKCCGLDSYKDWFSHNWYDKIRDYEWDPSLNKRIAKYDLPYVDSVPLSCCKSGTCIPNYLSELGAHSINKHGCRHMLYNVLSVSMYTHLAMFLSIVLIEICILNCIAVESQSGHGQRSRDVNVRHIMSVNDNFALSSGSCPMNADDSENETDEKRQSDVENIKMSVYNTKLIVSRNKSNTANFHDIFGRVIDSQEENPGLPEYKVPQHLKEMLIVEKGVGIERCAYAEVSNSKPCEESLISQNWNHDTDQY